MFLEKLLANPHFMLFENSFVALLRLCAIPHLKHLRKLLVEKSLPFNNNLCRRIFIEVEIEVIVCLLENYVAEYIMTSRESHLKLSEKVDF